MNELQIAIKDNRNHFHPGEELVGEVKWQLDHAPRRTELRLVWYTDGRPNLVAEATIVRTIVFDKPRTEDRREFKFRLPDGPYSFAGLFTTLNWGLELVMLPSRRHMMVEFLFSPSTEGIYLGYEMAS